MHYFSTSIVCPVFNLLNILASMNLSSAGTSLVGFPSRISHSFTSSIAFQPGLDTTQLHVLNGYIRCFGKCLQVIRFFRKRASRGSPKLSGGSLQPQCGRITHLNAVQKKHWHELQQ
ncbi:hypothetical protein M758_UG086900 [Ceratodon purpureus]|nr:hypothetical protein M758_UG086900 [Ceratodon purpureus]